MARKNSVKVYIKNGYYHVYNRGVGKQEIFTDKKDYKVFLSYLKSYLSPPPDLTKLKREFTVKDGVFKGIPRQTKNYNDKIKLIAYCLMPNHFHFIINQNDSSSMRDFLHSLSIRYSMYFNKRHDRVGPLFQGRYKAVLINDENYLLHLSRYIHLNPQEYTKDIVSAYSSYADYVGFRKTAWVKPNIILSYFENSPVPEIRKNNTYKDFVEKYKEDDIEIIGNLILE